MKNLITGAVVLGMFAFAGTAFAAAPNWTLNAPNAIVFSCGGGEYAHTLETVTNNPDGSFSGTGSYDANGAYTWDITGNIDGDGVTFQIVYTGANPGYTLNGVGTIGNDGSIAGTVDNNCQTFSMPAGSATLIPVAVVPTTKDECKNGGWMDLARADGSTFKNQGDCIQYVNTGK